MLIGFLARERTSRRGRLIGRALAYWTVAAAIVALTLAIHEQAEQAAGRELSEAASISRLELAQRSVLNALGASRSDLHLLASMGVVREYLRAPDAVRRAALARDLFAFMATRGWCERVVVSSGAGRVTGERSAGASACEPLHGVVAGFPSSEALLATVRASGSTRLCLGLPLGRTSDGEPSALVAEVEPRALFPDLAVAAPGSAGFFLREAQGQWLVPPDAAAGPLVLSPVRLRPWSGPSAGTWFLAYAPDRTSGTAVSWRKEKVASMLLLLLASAGGALALARAAEARRRAEHAARQQLALFQRVSDNLPSPIYLKDARGRYLGCNAAFETLAGRSRDAILGRDVRALLSDASARPHEQADRAILTDGVPREYETQVAGPDGRVRDLLVSKAPVRNEDGQVTGLTACLLDITDRKAAELDLRRSLEALRVAKEAAEAGTRAKSEFLAMMSHEMRTPLHAALGATELLLDAPLDREQREHLAMARTAGQALLELIDDLLDFSRIEAGRLDLERLPFDLHRLVEDTLALVAGRARNKQLELACAIDADVPRRVSGDPGRLRQVLLNLVANAIEFTEHGSVRAHVELVRREADGLVLRLRVRDTGAGIEAALLPGLFEPFARSEGSSERPRAGSGLELAMTRRLVELMGGTIEAQSQPGRGSEFTCSLRLGEAPADEAALAAPLSPGLAAGRRVRALLVEDNRVNQRVTGALLARLGCDVDLAGDGAEALAALVRRSYDVVFMDCRMPGMDGYEATREIRRREGDGPHVPIVALTAHALRGDRERCLAAGMSDYLAKPIDLASLGRMLERHVTKADHAAAQAVAEPAPGPGASLVDPRALVSLKSLEKDGPGFLATLVREFDESARQRLGDMQLAARGGDGDGLRGAAHSLKGSAGIFGANGMAELCRRLEQLADEQATSEAAPLITRLSHEHAAVMSVLQEAAASA